MWSRSVKDSGLAELGFRLDVDEGRPPYRADLVSLADDVVVAEVRGLLLEEVYATARRLVARRSDLLRD